MKPVKAKSADDRISVFVRVRPLTPVEQESGYSHLDGLVRTNSDEDSSNEVALLSPTGASIGGFDGILGQTSSNRDVFERAFAGRLSSVLCGGVASLFCYGYTGGGKTHTIIGYGEEEGVFFLAAKRLLEKLEKGLYLRASVCEIYNDGIFDLLGDEKRPCTIRTNEAGQVVVKGPIKSRPLEGVAVNKKGEHATLVTQAEGLRSVSVHKPEDLQEIHRSCVTDRTCGISTTHHQSSRSHAILRLEVVNDVMQTSREEIERLQAELPALKNAAENTTTRSHNLKYCFKRVLRSSEGMTNSLATSSDDMMVIDHVTNDGKIVLCNVEGSPQTLEEWSVTLNLPDLCQTSAQMLREYPGGAAERDAAVENNAKQGKMLKKLLREKEKELVEAKVRLEEIMSKGPKSLGGSMLLVDLAGADYDHRSGRAQKESAAINKSLFALKECFRSLAQVSSQRPPFRSSKLTRILEESLTPAPDRESVSVMLVNVGPAAQLEKGTVNALRYGQMFGSKGKVANTTGIITSKINAEKPWKKKRAGKVLNGVRTGLTM